MARASVGVWLPDSCGAVADVVHRAMADRHANPLAAMVFYTEAGQVRDGSGGGQARRACGTHGAKARIDATPDAFPALLVGLPVVDTGARPAEWWTARGRRFSIETQLPVAGRAVVPSRVRAQRAAEEQEGAVKGPSEGIVRRHTECRYH